MEIYLNSLQLIGMMPQGEGGGSAISTVVMLSLIFGIFYFMIIRPQQKRQKERTSLLESVKKGYKIVTIGGVHGTVVGIEEKTLLIEIADGVKVKYEKSAVSNINRPLEDNVGKTS